MAPAALIVATAFLLAWNAAAKDQDPSVAGGPLDGMVFVGLIGPADNPDVSDRLYFENGKFWSGECIRCGFEPGVYWTRRVDGGIAFQGTLESPDRGSFAYEGFVRDGGKIEVSINWRHERWYWTIDRELRFVGEAATGETVGMTLEEASALANRRVPVPESCPS